ncbi:iron-containing alcohol dehydrogenase [Agathobaculum sp.]|uniref:iron-containing alcohol dehydrogenase n=1 Tax=Agathobaculum sp. TaxID=2048138 RepID=UPI003AB80AAE
MNNFIFENKTKVYFGKGGVKEYLGSLLANYGNTVLLAYGGGSIKRNGVYDEVTAILHDAGKTVIEFSGIMPNPTYAKVQEGAKLARDNHIDLILAVGGGSVSDCCKIVSAQANLDEDIWEMQTVKHALPNKFIPLGTIVTVFGTGSEMNNGAVITNEDKKIKGALWGAQADFAFLDPTYTMSVPMKQVISGAFDTLSHAMETYFGKPDDNNLSDDINEAVMRSTIRNIRVLLTDPENYDARSELAWASAMAENGILKIGKVTDFQCHMIEHQLGAYTNCNHGAGLAVIHPVMYRHICKDGAARFARFARNVWGIAPLSNDEATALAGVEALAAFIKEIGLPTTFAELGIPADSDLRAVADSTVLTAGCCKKLTHDEVYEILQECK